MIQHDYLLRLIEEFTRALSRIQELRTGDRPADADQALDHQFQLLVQSDRASLLRLSVTEILARIVRQGASHEVHARTFFLVALFRESGALAEEQGDIDLARENHLQALRLLFACFQHLDPAETPRFVPTVDGLLSLLPAQSLSADLHAAAMHHFERLGRFADAENSLFHLLDQAAGTAGLREFGTAFYQRLESLNDATLERGRLGRAELAEGLQAFQKRANV
ncbi:MAG: DUF6483 family protein [Limisphaerales bacterium]